MLSRDWHRQQYLSQSHFTSGRSQIEQRYSWAMGGDYRDSGWAATYRRFIDPPKTRMITYLVPRTSATNSVALTPGSHKESICPQPWKPKRCGRLRLTACTASWAPRWLILAAGTCRSNIPRPAG